MATGIGNPQGLLGISILQFKWGHRHNQIYEDREMIKHAQSAVTEVKNKPGH